MRIGGPHIIPARYFPFTVKFFRLDTVFRLDTDEQVAEITVEAPPAGQLAGVHVPGIGPKLGVAVRVEMHCADGSVHHWEPPSPIIRPQG